MLQEKKSRLSVPLIVSIVLHVGLIAILGYSAWQYVSPYTNENQGESIDAIMVDTSIMTEQYQRQQQHQLSTQQVKQQQQAQIEQQARELKEKQLIEQQRLKELEKERLLAIEKQKKEAAAAAAALAEKQRLEDEAQKAKIQLQEQQRQAELAKQKQLEEQQRLQKEREKAEQERQKAVAEAEKAKQEAEKARLQAEQKAQEAQQQAMLNDILGGLTSNTPKAQQGASTQDLNEYQSQVHNAITNKFINPLLYSGKNCVLKIQLAPDGLLLTVTAEEGDPVLCREAISATKLATFPKPKSSQLYQQVKNLTIDFRPK